MVSKDFITVVKDPLLCKISCITSFYSFYAAFCVFLQQYEMDEMIMEFEMLDHNGSIWLIDYFSL